VYRCGRAYERCVASATYQQRTITQLHATLHRTRYAYSPPQENGFEQSSQLFP